MTAPLPSRFREMGRGNNVNGGDNVNEEKFVDAIDSCCILTFDKYLIRKFILTRNAMRSNNRDDLLRLSFNLKISIFWRPIQNPDEYLW